MADWMPFCGQFYEKWRLAFNRRLQQMKVFVAGASGAIGGPLITALVAAKHEVIGMTSRDAGIKALRKKGVEGVVVNALDAEAVRAHVAKIRPDAIIDELTSLPPPSSRIRRSRGAAACISSGV